MEIVYVFVVLVYRNVLDLKNLVENLNQKIAETYRVIIVDAYFSDEVSYAIKKICDEFNCDYLQTENRGYSFGNNRGIEYVLRKYVFDYLIVCNPDVLIKTMVSNKNLLNNADVIAPVISGINGKMQNPYWVINNQISEFFIYLGYKNNINILIKTGAAFNRILRDLTNYTFLKKRNNRIRIYAAHGSFIIFNRKIVLDDGFRFNEKHFLFYEEASMARFMKKHGRSIIYDKRIRIFHKEDGSIKLENINEYKYLRESYLNYYCDNL